MSEQEIQSQTSALEMYRAIVGIGAFCALVIVIVFQSTAARIADNQERFLRALEKGELPVERGLRRNADDEARRRIILDLMCHFRLDYKDHGDAETLRYPDACEGALAPPSTGQPCRRCESTKSGRSSRAP